MLLLLLLLLLCALFGKCPRCLLPCSAVVTTTAGLIAAKRFTTITATIAISSGGAMWRDDHKWMLAPDVAMACGGSNRSCTATLAASVAATASTTVNVGAGVVICSTVVGVRGVHVEIADNVACGRGRVLAMHSSVAAFVARALLVRWAFAAVAR